jgi:hypothetical protein
MNQAVHRWAELESTPSPGVLRGRFLENHAGANLARDFPGIDDFRNGFATQIRTRSAPNPQRLLAIIRDDTFRLRIVPVDQDLEGIAANGERVVIPAGSIQAKGLLEGVPGAQTGW